MLLPDILHAEIVDHEGKRDGEDQVFPEAQGVFGGSISVGGEDRC